MTILQEDLTKVPKKDPTFTISGSKSFWCGFHCLVGYSTPVSVDSPVTLKVHG